MPMKERTKHIAMALVALLAAANVAGCGGSAPASTAAGAPVQEATVTRGTMADVVQVAGQVVALTSRTLTFGTVSGRVQEVLVRPGQTVQKGQALARIDAAEQERKLREAQADLKVAEATLADAQRVATAAEAAKADADLATAEAALAAAQVKLAAAQAAGIASLEEAVADAQAALQLARDQLRQQELTANQSSLRTLEYQQAFFQRTLRDARTDRARADAQASLAAVERDLANARGARESALSTARDDVTKKEEELAKAQAALARARAGEDDPTTSARLDREQAKANVDKARKAVEELKAGLDSATVRAAKTSYDAALAKVESAKAAIAASTLTAPFAGVVWMAYVGPDDWVNSSDKVVYLADPTDLRVSAQASEMDVAHLSVGQQVRLTFDALPGKVFAGQVLSLPLRGQQSGSMSIYPIEVSLEQEGSDVRSGMLANVHVVIGEKPDVLMIPVAAVQYRANNETYVQVRAPDGQVREQTVEVGIDDGIMAEVRTGLSEGQTVLVPLVRPMGPGSYGMMGGVPMPAQRVIVK